MSKYFFLFCIVFSVRLISQPAIDGVITDAHYSVAGTNTALRNGFGDNNDIGTVKYYADGTNIYIGITGELSSNDNIVLFLNFSGYSGRTGTLAGSGSSSTGVFRTSLTAGDYGLDGATLDMDVDYALSFNEGNGATNLYLDVARYGTTGYLNSGYVGSSDQSGNSTSSADIATIFGGSGSIQFAYRNDFSVNSDNGIEMKIPISVFSGVTADQTVRLFALITNASGYISNECIPGDLGASNIGNDGDLGSIGSQDLFTAALALPVELVSFTIDTQNKKNLLRWRTATEINNAGFEVQRSNKGEWRKIGFVDGHGTTNIQQEYSFADIGLAPGRYSYRLKQIDRDGKFEYSSVIEAAVELSETDFSLSPNFPNPFNPTTNISFAVKERQFVTLKVFNLAGQEVASLVNGIVEPNVLQTVQFSGKDLSSGVYFYSLTTKDRYEVRKLMLLK